MNQSEIILQLHGYNLSRAEEMLKSIQSNASGVMQQQKARKWEIFYHHLEHNKFYRSFVNGAEPGKWDDIPVMTKSAYQRSIATMITSGYKKSQLYIGNTSGSSGQPFVFAKDKFCHALAWALIIQRYKIYDIQLNSFQARFFGIPLTGKAGLSEKFKDKLLHRLRFPVFDLSEKALHEFLNVFSRKRFEYLYGYTNSIRHFCQYLLGHAICLKDVCRTLKCVIVTAEMCNEFDRRIISQATGVPCVVEYGASETGILGFEYKDGLCHASDELMFFEVDERGSLLITSLFNYAFPLIRYKIGDQAVIDKDKLPDGTTIDKILGRSDDLIRLNNGKVIAGISIYYCSKHILEKMGGIKEMYVTQTDFSHFNVFYVCDRHLENEEKKLIKKSFDIYLQPGLKIDFIRTDVIRRKANGKLQIFHSELNN
jgi:phenylacetate-CoA ligase